MKPHTLRTLLALTSAGLLLTGCAGNVVDPAPIETVQAKAQTGKAKPVSYTHLRAHET